MGLITFNGGSFQTTPGKQATAGNYIDFTDSGVAGWAQQYMPDIYEKEVSAFGDRSVAGFLDLVGAEIPLASDQAIWTEQGRLHIAYTGGTLSIDAAGSNTITGLTDHAIRAGQTVVISDGSNGNVKAYVSNADPNSDGDAITVKCLTNSTGCVAAGLTAGTVSLFVYGSMFAKGSDSMVGSVEPGHQTLTNNPLILRDFYSINGSDMAQIGWVEVEGSGFLWYVKAASETKQRWEDYLETALVEAEIVTNSTLTEAEGSEGLFAAIRSRGHVHEDGINGSSAADDLADFDSMLKKLDKQGAIEENVLFVDRDMSLNIDDMLAAQNSYGSGGTSWGVFNNSEDMALNLGFSGFRRGSYDFYKTDWKYLNDGATRGALQNSDVTGVLVPAGSSSVYDKNMSKKVARPMLHIRYRAAEGENRKTKSWIHGGAGGATTSGEDKMKVEYLSERCLITQAANNFVLFGDFAA